MEPWKTMRPYHNGIAPLQALEKIELNSYTYRPAAVVQNKSAKIINIQSHHRRKTSMLKTKSHRLEADMKISEPQLLRNRFAETR